MRIRNLAGRVPPLFPPFSLFVLTTTSFVDQVISGDCLTVLPQLPDASVDLVLTDPPYLVRYQSRDGRRVANDDTDAWLVPAFVQAYRVLRCGRFCVSFCGFT